MTVMTKEKMNMSPKNLPKQKLLKSQKLTIKNKKSIPINKVSLQRIQNKYLKTRMKKKPMFLLKVSQKNKSMSINH